MNQVIISGRITKDPELVQAGKYKKCDFTVAVQNIRSDKADFIDCIVWGKQAENLVKYMRKGSQILVKGFLQVSHYETKDGSKRKDTKITCEQIEFLGSKQEPKEDQGRPIEADNTPPSPYTFMKEEPHNIATGDLPF